MAFDLEKWVANIPVDAHKFNADEIMAEAENLQTTCHVLTLMHEDYEGKAEWVLHTALDNNDFRSFQVKHLNGASDKRTMICLHRLTGQITPKPSASSVEISAIEALRNAWGVAAGKAKENALSEPPLLMPVGWQETRDKNSGFSYYFDQSTAETSWIRPIARWGAKGVANDPPPAIEGKEM